jgi:hypothetical protein
MPRDNDFETDSRGPENIRSQLSDVIYTKINEKKKEQKLCYNS